MSYLHSEKIQECINNIEDLNVAVSVLKQQLDESVFHSDDYVVEYLHTLYALMERSHNLYTRMTIENEIEDNHEAKFLRDDLIHACITMGMPAGYDPGVWYTSKKEEILRELTNLTGEDFTKEVDL